LELSESKEAINGDAASGHGVRIEQDSLGSVNVQADRLWGAQTQRSLEHFSIGDDLMPREMIPAYAIVKKAAALVNHRAGRLGEAQKDLIVRVCDEILAGQHRDQFPLHVWMTGSGTQFNMNVNEVIANRCAQIAGQPLGSHTPVHPNDHVNMSQSSNDSFPTAMNVGAALGMNERRLPAVKALRDALLGYQPTSWHMRTSLRPVKHSIISTPQASARRLPALSRISNRQPSSASAATRFPPTRADCSRARSWRRWRG
jgi:fumarate hydratase class II